MNKTKIALLSYTYDETTERNKQKISRLLRKVEDVDFVLLPEDSFDANGQCVEEIPGETSRWLQEKASEHGVNIIGNLTEKSGNFRYNTSLVIDRKGHIAGSYRKVQLNHADRTLRNLTPGKDLPTFIIDGIPFGISICYDAWYPETTRGLVLSGAKLIFIPFKEERPYIPYLRSLVKARAIENVIPLVGCGAGGFSRRFDRNFKKFAFFVLPSGKIVKEETQTEYALHVFPPLDDMIARERSRMNWERPFDRSFTFDKEQEKS
jgi:predicted amidohydrolase